MPPDSDEEFYRYIEQLVKRDENNNTIDSIIYDGIEVKRWRPKDGITPFFDENNNPEGIKVLGTPMIFLVPVEHTICSINRRCFMTFPPDGYPQVRGPIRVLLWPEIDSDDEVSQFIGYRCNSWLRAYDRTKATMAAYRYQQSLNFINGLWDPSTNDLLDPSFVT